MFFCVLCFLFLVNEVVLEAFFINFGGVGVFVCFLNSVLSCGKGECFRVGVDFFLACFDVFDSLVVGFKVEERGYVSVRLVFFLIEEEIFG